MCQCCANDLAANMPKNQSAGRLHDPRCIHCCARYIQLLRAHPALDRQARQEMATRALRDFVALGHSEREVRDLVAQTGTARAPFNAAPTTSPAAARKYGK